MIDGLKTIRCKKDAFNYDDGVDFFDEMNKPCNLIIKDNLYYTIVDEDFIDNVFITDNNTMCIIDINMKFLGYYHKDYLDYTSLVREIKINKILEDESSLY